jgi:plasmid stabilization system protein ParE
MVKKKLRHILWDDDAKLYFKAAIRYIKKETAQGAKKVKAEIFKTVNLLPDNPLMFEADKLKTDNDGSYRAFVVY